MTVSDAVASRRSIRRFLDRAVDKRLLEGVLEKAQRAPSGGNLQPWHAIILSGEPLERMIEAVQKQMARGRDAQQPEYEIYPPKLPEPYRSRRYEVGEALYESLGIARGDKGARLMQMAKNFSAFGAPVCLYCYTPSFMGLPQWSDLGMWMQTIMLLLREEGLDSCPQEAWSIYGKTVREQLGLSDDMIFFSGLSIGYRDPEAPENRFAVPRAPISEAIEFRGFD